MIRMHAALLLGVTAGLVLATSPAANATPLDDQNRTITIDRAKYGGACSPLNVNGTLESMAQDAVASFRGDGTFGVAAGDPDASRYTGEIRSFVGYGDPQAAALTAAYEQGAGPMLSNCEFLEFGSGFKRDSGEDAVMIIFGKPAAAAPEVPDAPEAPAVPEAPAAVPPTQCPEGSTTSTVVPPARCEPPKNKVRLNITRDGINAVVAITNSSALPAECDYTATRTAGFLGPESVNESVSVGPGSTGNIDGLLWPALGSSYRATAKCTATYDGGEVVIGESTQNVNG